MVDRASSQSKLLDIEEEDDELKIRLRIGLKLQIYGLQSW